MQLPFAAEDDYGITGGAAQITLDLAQVDRRFGLATDPEPRRSLVIDLPLPISGNRAKFSDMILEDVSEHPFANLPVEIRLTATDAMAQQGEAPVLQGCCRASGSLIRWRPPSSKCGAICCGTAAMPRVRPRSSRPSPICPKI